MSTGVLSHGTRRLYASVLTAAQVALVACASCAGTTTGSINEENRARPTSAELTTFEIRDDNVDRFEHCPPPGDIGQDWLPPIADWRPAAAAPQVEPAPIPIDGVSDAPASPTAPASLRELVDQAERETHFAFRHCYHENLRYDPTQDGHVAIILRVGGEGRVEAVETSGACDLAPEAIACMRDHAKHLRLRPPASGYATVVVPGVFTEDHPRPRLSNDAYTAAAYVAVESLRIQLHRCEEAAKRERTGLFARATMTIDVDASGHASHVSVDLWKGSQPLLACAGEVLRGAKYPAPPAGHARIIAPIAYNLKLEE
jgi:hypothetical protein